VIELMPAWAKGYARLGNALAGEGKQAEAVKAYAAGLAHDPTASEQAGRERVGGLRWLGSFWDL
jgi:predicted TPR repeat methyltransferase